MKNQLYTLFFVLAGIAPYTGIHAQINAYAKVTAISGKTLTLSNITQTYHTFTAGEMVIVIQMKDGVIGSNTTNRSTFGTIASIANAGVFETATISSISGSTMTLAASLSHTYNTGSNGIVQVVSFNTLGTTDYTLSSSTTAMAWNGNVGGVLAFQVNGKLTLSASVNADGKGFNGGGLNTGYESSCEPNVYDTTSSNYAYKGEGIEGSSTITYTTHTGRGPLASGGGGGSDDNGGGGGGANYTSGGQGGQGWTCTATTASGGLGGVPLGSYISGGRIFMGGGGGAGQQNNGVGTAGGAGGGIIIIKAGTLATSCTGSVGISSSGVIPGNSGNDGAGGGGAGGTVMLGIANYSVSSSCPLTVSANGGNGGSVGDPNAHGGGGGGGQGAVIYTVTLPTSNITSTTSNGTGGLNSSSSGAASAGNGGGSNNAGIMSGIPTVLPVSILSFSATKAGQQNVVSWSCSKLLQHVQFIVQRSADGVSFDPIGTVDGIVDGANTESYSFTDAAPLRGRNFYRVRQTDAAGNDQYTSTGLVDWTDAAAAFRIAPNPAQRSFAVQLMNLSTEEVSLSIEDMSGTPVYRSLSMANAGRVLVTIGKTLPAGIYLIRVATKTGAETGKLLLRP